MPQFRKKPVEVEARKLAPGEGHAIADWINDHKTDTAYVAWDGRVMIETLEGTMAANIDDYVIRGVKGEFYACKPDIFEQTYEPVEEG